MSLLHPDKLRIRLSRMEIDVNKDWTNHSIYNLGGLKVTGHILPDTGGLRDLGSKDLYFAYSWVTNERCWEVCTRWAERPYAYLSSLGTCALVSGLADATTTLKDSPELIMRGEYWDGTKSTYRDMYALHRMLSTTPTSELVFRIAGTDYACIGDEEMKLYRNLRMLKDDAKITFGSAEDVNLYRAGADLLKTDDTIEIPAGVNILGRSYAGTAVMVTETVATLKDSAAPGSPKNVLYPLNAVVDASNPAGSTVTLYVEIRLLHSDGTESTIDSFSVAEGATATRDYLSTDIAKEFKDGVSVTAVRLYAYCSATPATGYEPSVTLTSVKGVQF